MNLAVVDLETKNAVALTNFRDYDVISVNWVGNDRLLYRLGQFNTPTGPGIFDGGGLFMVSRDGKEARKLAPTIRELRATRQFVDRGLRYLRSVPNNDEEVMAVGRLRSADSVDIYRLNVVTGRSTLITERRPELTESYVLDRNRVPRVAVSRIKDSLTQIVWYRKDDQSSWEEIIRYDSAKPGTFDPLYFESDNQTLLVATNANRETMGIFRYDPNDRKLGEVVAQHKKFDMGSDGLGGAAPGVFTDPLTDEVLGYSVAAERPETVYLTESDNRLQKMIDGALPNTYNTFRRIRGNEYLVTSRSDREPASWYLLDEGKKTLTDLFSSRPWLTRERLVEMKPFYYTTRDGLEILGYYFLPRGYKQGEKLPTVVHIHGGPTVRADQWGAFSFGVVEGQLLASRGYAVIVPNFRVTPGLGNKVLYSGFGEFGRKMVDDHEDAAKWGIKEGFVDPERICISGASYGGYAVLMSLARFPQTFKCGVAGLVVSDPELILTSPAGDIPFNNEAVEFWKRMIGVESLSKIPADIAPVNLADKIKQPIMFYAGTDDIRTPLEQTSKMIRALERAGNAPKTVVIKAEEGHGFGKLENNIELYTKMVDFLDTYIGKRK